MALRDTACNEIIASNSMRNGQSKESGLEYESERERETSNGVFPSFLQYSFCCHKHLPPPPDRTLCNEENIKFEKNYQRFFLKFSRLNNSGMKWEATDKTYTFMCGCWRDMQPNGRREIAKSSTKDAEGKHIMEHKE